MFRVDRTGKKDGGRQLKYGIWLDHEHSKFAMNDFMEPGSICGMPDSASS